MAELSNQKSEKSFLVALLLSIFLGLIGAHRFYVGKIGTGGAHVFDRRHAWNLDADRYHYDCYRKIQRCKRVSY